MGYWKLKYTDALKCLDFFKRDATDGFFNSCEMSSNTKVCSGASFFGLYSFFFFSSSSLSNFNLHCGFTCSLLSSSSISGLDKSFIIISKLFVLPSMIESNTFTQFPLSSKIFINAVHDESTL